MLSSSVPIDDVNALSAHIPLSEPCMCCWFSLRDGNIDGCTAYCLFAWQDASPNGRDIGQQATAWLKHETDVGSGPGSVHLFLPK